MKKNNIIVENYTRSKIVFRNIFRTVDFFLKLTKTNVKTLSISFIGDEEMELLNRKYLSHKGSTDIITFDYSDNQSTADDIDAEMIICVDQAKRQSKNYNVLLNEELNRLLFHGFLHLTGFDDKDAKKIKIMKSREEEILRLWNQYNLCLSNNFGAING
ncbi:MAG: rRNA maturation RNase YbeY [Candidatus Delongbacteria bacterium]|nr:rRNA maturation RNase YbeY [Candidatus Delongbacteria bacterium]MCG2761554.1 rRNA maturation RNase YbeY [Candidatus Delongbacteria bacterium]